MSRGLCSPHRRRLLTANLRETALSTERETRSEFVLWDRVRLVRRELLALADELEAATSVDPRTMVDLDRLLCDSCVSPLLNESIPLFELHSTVRSVRFRVASSSVTEASLPDPPVHKRLSARMLHPRR